MLQTIIQFIISDKASLIIIMNIPTNILFHLRYREDESNVQTFVLLLDKIRIWVWINKC